MGKGAWLSILMVFLLPLSFWILAWLTEIHSLRTLSCLWLSFTRLENLLHKGRRRGCPRSPLQALSACSLNTSVLPVAVPGTHCDRPTQRVLTSWDWAQSPR